MREDNKIPHPIARVAFVVERVVAPAARVVGSSQLGRDAVKWCVTVLLAVCASSCSKPASDGAPSTSTVARESVHRGPEAGIQNLIVGKWKRSGSVREVMAFSATGELTITCSAQDLPEIQAKYGCVDEKTIEIVIVAAPFVETDDGRTFRFPSWMTMRDVSDMMSGREVRVRAHARIVSTHLTLDFGGREATEYGRVE